MLRMAGGSVLCALLLALTACGKDSTLVTAQSCSLTPDSRASKLQIETIAESALNISLNEIYAKGSSFIAVIKDACTDEGEISSEIKNKFLGVTPSGVRSYDWTLNRDMSRTDLEQLALDDACVEMISAAGAEDMQQERAIEIQALPSDPQIARAKHLSAIGAAEAYDIFYSSKIGIKREITIAIIDSGVRLDHEDLQDNLWINTREIPDNGIDDDGNGYVDDVYGYNFASRKADPSPEKTSANGSWQWAHGTRVAGLAAATADNSKGTSGIAGHFIKIMALNNLGKDKYMAQSDTANSIRYAVDNGADVINLSLGGSSASADYKNALKYAISKGVVVLAAAGNESKRIGTSYSAAGLASTTPGLLSIGNFQSQSFNRSTTSNYSTTYVELGAPGTNTMSSLLYTTDASSSTAYTGFSGTSAATPVASGAAALAIGLINSRGYTYTPGDIEALLLQSATKSTQLQNYFKDGNALNLASLARLINERYPDRGFVVDKNPQKPGGYSTCSL